MGGKGRKRGRKKKPNNDKNNKNTSQPRQVFIPPEGDKGKDTRKGEEEKLVKVSQEKKGRSITIRG